MCETAAENDLNLRRQEVIWSEYRKYKLEDPRSFGHRKDRRRHLSDYDQRELQLPLQRAVYSMRFMALLGLKKLFKNAIHLGFSSYILCGGG